jgi:hypothetical protein
MGEKVKLRLALLDFKFMFSCDITRSEVSSNMIFNSTALHHLEPLRHEDISVERIPNCYKNIRLLRMLKPFIPYWMNHSCHSTKKP